MWLEVDEDLPEHPKALRLCAKLMNPLAWAYVIKLWRWCCKYAPTGDLTDFAAEEIEYGLGWTLDAGKLYTALKTSGFIEDASGGRVVVHDWMEHQGRALKKMDKDRKRKQKERDARPRDVRGTSNGRPRNVHVTAQVPNQTKPDPTQPNQTSVKGDCAETAPPSSSPPAAQVPPDGPDQTHLLTFPCDGDPRFWGLTLPLVAEWRAAFPSLDVSAECRKALAWVNAAPARRKTAGGMARFLFAWLSRAQNRNPAARGSPGTPNHRPPQKDLRVVR